jgi:hypothetical protein
MGWRSNAELNLTKSDTSIKLRPLKCQRKISECKIAEKTIYVSRKHSAYYKNQLLKINLLSSSLLSILMPRI